MYIAASTLILVIGLYVFVIVTIRGAVNMLVDRVNMLDQQLAEAISKLPAGLLGDGEPINPIQNAIAGLIQNVVTNNQERGEDGRFVKATIIEPAQNND